MDGRIRSILPEYRRGEAHHVSPEIMDELLHMISPEARFVGGGALTTASLLARLGASVAFAGSVGSDEEGAELRDTLAARRVASLVYGHSPNRRNSRTGRSLYLRHTRQQRGTTVGAADQTPVESIFVSPSAALSMEQLPKGLCTKVRESLKPRRIYLEGFLLPRRPLIEEIAELCRVTGAELILDLGSAGIVREFRTDSLSTLLPLTQLLFGTEDECAALLPELRESPKGKSSKENSSAVAGRPELFAPNGRFHAFLRQIGIPAAVVKRGASDILLFEEERSTAIPTYPAPEELRDTTGAGDILAGGTIFSLGKGYNLAAAVSYGAYIAAASLGGWGASRILSSEIYIKKPEQILHTG